MDTQTWYVRLPNNLIDGPLSQEIMEFRIRSGVIHFETPVSIDAKSWEPARLLFDIELFEKAKQPRPAPPKSDEQAAPLTEARVKEIVKSTITNQPNDRELTESQKRNVTYATYGCIGCAGIFLLCIVVLFSMASGKKSPPSNYEAATFAEEFVTRKLKAPASAKFPHYSEYTITPLGSGQFVVSGYVDAQNSFGAMLRNRFVVTLTIDANGNATLQDISIFNPAARPLTIP